LARKPAARTSSPPPPVAGRSRATLLVAVLFAASGAAALVDEVLWTRWLTLSLGASSRAVVLVLAVFMGGIGLGSYLAGRVGDRALRRVLLLFAGAEALVGAWAFLSAPLLGRWLPGLAATLGRATGSGSLPVPLRGLLAAAALLLPTLAMGASLPWLVRFVTGTGLLPGRATGRLYALNTLGGAAGAWLATFALVPRFGLTGTVLLAGTTSLLVAAASLALARTIPPGASEPPGGVGSAPEPPDGPGAPDPARLLLAASLGFGASGLVGLALEVTTHRVLAVLAGSSVYAFTVMLAAFLLGIGLGSLAAGRLADRTRHPALGLAVTLGGLGLGAGLLPLLLREGTWTTLGRILGAPLRGNPFAAEMGAAVGVLLLPTVMLGAAVPFVGRMAGLVPGRIARRFGLAYALNTAGAVTGSALAGLVLVPHLGTARSFTLLAVLAGLAGVAVAVAGLPPGPRAKGILAAGLLAAIGAGAGLSADPVREAMLGRFRGADLLVFREGPVQTIAVTRESNDQQLTFLRLVTNRTSLTGTHFYAQRYMRLLGHLPALYATAPPERALVICLGTGMTAGAVATWPGIRELGIAEISPEVVDVADLFRDVSGNVLDDPRTRLHVEDGREVLLASAGGWDLVTLEPPPPRDAGVVSLYSVDFYRLCRARLAPGGVVAQWIPLHSQSPGEIRMLVRAFLDGFPHVLGILPVERDLLLLGSGRPLQPDPAELARRMALPGVAASLAGIGFEGPPALLATVVADREALARFAGNAPTVTDDRPIVEYFAPFGRRPRPGPVDALVASPPPLADLLGGPAPAGWRETFDRARRALLALHRSAWAWERGNGREGRRLADEAFRLRPDDPWVLWSTGLSDAHLARLRAEAERAGTAPAWRRLAGRLARRGRLDEAEAAYRRALELDPDDPETLLRFASFLGDLRGRVPEARRLLRRFLEVAPRHPAAPAVRRLLGAR